MDKPSENAEILIPGLPFAFAQALLKKLESGQLKNGKKEIIKFLYSNARLNTMEWRWVNIRNEGGTSEYSEGVSCDSPNLGDHMHGRQLSEGDLQRLANEAGSSIDEIMRYCHEEVRKGRAEWIPAIKKEGRGWRCMRCGEKEIKEWPSIYGLAGTCPSCTALGALSSLQALLRVIDKNRESSLSPADSNPVSFSPHWELSKAQKRASLEILNFVSSETGKDLLLWAACGAGKTEVCFPAAAWALKRGFKVLFAAPRQDVVLDVAPRLEQDFPGLRVSVLTGVSTEHFAPASLVLATTHQVLRFYQTFDLIFMDEVDAFPYHGNSALEWGLKQSLKPEGKIIYLTATPSSEQQTKVQNGGMKLVRLPARHHRHPLPVPEWIKYFTGSREPTADHSELAQWIKCLSQLGPVLVFVPKISWVALYVKILRISFPEWKIEGSYSSDQERRVKIEKLRKGIYPVFVSTSILERGVTVPNVQVIVLEADHEVFDERGLVQMAGRVGRTQENPKGKALFLAQQKTPEIEKAIAWIQEQNRIALEQGLLDPD
ncbi:helicase-related protein [Desulfitobacterium sp. AusDCA]|uniref:helicase-related protein n=1 Tax=Desulfitobacterium sp. AusDCA TaxID=3240383 RepID=UPI003DA73C6A